MALESANYISGLVDTNPGATDNVSQGDDHLRLIKKVLKDSFPSVDIAVNAIHTSASAPSTSISAGLIWFDTTNNLLKIRNEDNNAWITLPISPVTSNTVDIDGGAIDGTPIGATSESTGKFSSVNIAGDGATVTGIKDEDDMASDSAVKLATQQSIKAYVDSQVTAQDLDITTDSGSIDIDLDSETLTIAGGEGIDTSATGTTVTIAGEDASTSNKGIASFNSDNFAASSGDITIKDGGVANAELADMAANTVKVRDANSSGVPSDKAVADTEILIGDGTGFTAASLSGDATMTNAGAVSVVKIQGEAVSSTAATNDQYLKFSSASNEWQKVDVLAPDRLTTKGDLLVYNTVDSETRLPVGTNDYALLADYSATNGVDWKQVQTTTIADDAVTYEKMQNLGTANRVIGGTSTGTLAEVQIVDAMVASGIDAAKIADGSVSNTEFQYINSLSSNAQTQIDAKASTSSANTWTAGQRGEITALTSGTSITIDMADSNNFSVTLSHNATFANPSNDTAGQSGSIFITQDGTGSRTASWGTDWDFAGGTAPTLTTTAGAVDRIDYVILDSSNIHAVATLNYS